MTNKEIELDKVLNKPIFFIDRNGAFRISKAVRISGNTITVMDSVGGKERIHPQTTRIFGVVTGTVNSMAVYRPIVFKKTRLGKKLKTKKQMKDIKAMQVKPLRTKRPRPGRPKQVS